MDHKTVTLRGQHYNDYYRHHQLEIFMHNIHEEGFRATVGLQQLHYNRFNATVILY